MKIYISEELIDKYLKGECSPEEEELMLAWYDSFEENELTGDVSEKEWEEIQSSIFAKINQNPDIENSRNALKKQTLRRRIIALGLLGATACLLFFFYPAFFPSEPEIVEWSYSRKINNSNQIKKEILNDQSVIWLQPKSLVIVDKDFNKINRRIWLKGEAFFEVKHDASRPFIVMSGHTKTQVLGTSFNVKTGLSGGKTEVVVATGKVKVEVYMSGKVNTNRTVLLLPKDKITYIDNNNVLARNIDRNNVTAIYRRVDLHFEDNKVGDIIRRLNSMYSSNIYTEDSEINNYLLTADFDNMNLPDILDILEKSLFIEYEKTESGIKLITKSNKGV